MFWPLAVTIIFLIGFFTGVAAVILWLWLSAHRQKRAEAWHRYHPQPSYKEKTNIWR